MSVKGIRTALRVTCHFSIPLAAYVLLLEKGNEKGKAEDSELGDSVGGTVGFKPAWATQ